jgi:hypothetical protein
MCKHALTPRCPLSQVVRRQQVRMRGQYGDEQGFQEQLEGVAEQLQEAEGQLRALASSDAIQRNSQQHAEVLMSILDQVGPPRRGGSQTRDGAPCCLLPLTSTCVNMCRG